MKTAIAIAAHPDDIEFMMAGTLLLLNQRGYEIHYLNLSAGNLGSVVYDHETIVKMRLKEAQRSAEILSAHFHPPFCNDMEIFYDEKTLRQLAAIIREVKPTIVLTAGTARGWPRSRRTGRRGRGRRAPTARRPRRS